MPAKRRTKWIPTALKKGALHRELHIPQGHKIPVSELESAAKRGGKIGQRARFALTARGFKHKRRAMAGRR